MNLSATGMLVDFLNLYGHTSQPLMMTPTEKYLRRTWFMPSHGPTVGATVRNKIVKILCPPGIHILAVEDR